MDLNRAANLLVWFLEELDEEEYPGYGKVARELLLEVTALQERGQVAEPQVRTIVRALESLCPAAGPDLCHEILAFCEAVLPFETDL